MTIPARLTVMLLLSVFSPATISATVDQSINDENGLRGWHFRADNIEIELIQRLPDQTRAMLMKHRFSPAVIEQLAQSCMFQTIIRNISDADSGQVVTIDQSQWRIHHNGREQGIMLKEPLLESWGVDDADDAARLVVRWGMFPTRQEYLASDYNWGLTAFGLPPGTRFDLDVSWGVGGVQHTGRIPAIVCAPDVDTLK